MKNKLVVDIHTHTIASGHAYGTIRENALAASEKGLVGLGVSEHAPADMVLFAKNIDAIYTADPRLDPTAVKLDSITYADMLARGLKAMDSTATAFAMENNIPILCFGLADPENIYRAVMGEQIGTLVK